jgi:hypothetical protein
MLHSCKRFRSDLIMQTTNPELSVVMPVHNGLSFLDASIRSILQQTFSSFEFIILDDAGVGFA